jgi:hypothetical protein
MAIVEDAGATRSAMIYGLTRSELVKIDEQRFFSLVARSTIRIAPSIDPVGTVCPCDEARLDSTRITVRAKLGVSGFAFGAQAPRPIRSPPEGLRRSCLARMGTT